MDSVLTPPSPFCFDQNSMDLASGSLSENWSKWKRSYQIYSKACEIDKKSAEIQLNILLHVLGEQCRDILDQLTEKVSTATDVLKKLDDQFTKKKNITVERHHFFKRDQRENETIEQYVFELRRLSQTCEFGALKEELIKDRLVCGVSSAAICERLLREEDLNLKKALEICQAAVVSKAYSESIKGEAESVFQVQNKESESNDVMVVRRGQSTLSWRGRGGGAWCGKGRGGGGAAGGSRTSGSMSAPPPPAASQQSRYTGGIRRAPCGHCGCMHNKYDCPAYGKTCLRCSRRNHFARVCVYSIEESNEQVGETAE